MKLFNREIEIYMSSLYFSIHIKSKGDFVTFVSMRGNPAKIFSFIIFVILRQIILKIRSLFFDVRQIEIVMEKCRFSLTNLS